MYGSLFLCVCVSVYRACLEGLSSLRVTHKSQMMLREERTEPRFDAGENEPEAVEFLRDNMCQMATL